jgi:hypothetical protein
MSLPFRRRSRPRFNGSPSDHAVTEQWPAQLRTDDVDGATYKWGGASDIGVMAIGTFTRDVAAMPGYEDADIPEPTTRLRAAPPAPGMFPALPAAPPPPAQRRPDCAIFTILPGGGFGLLCGIDRWRRHADPETNCARHCFDALRASALAAGWRPDAYGRWACPRCKTDPAYVTPQPAAHWHPDGHDGRGVMITGHGGYRDAQFWLQVQAEHEVLRRTADGEPPGWAHLNAARAREVRERHGRHAAVTR